MMYLQNYISSQFYYKAQMHGGMGKSSPNLHVNPSSTFHVPAPMMPTIGQATPAQTAAAHIKNTQTTSDLGAGISPSSTKFTPDVSTTNSALENASTLKIETQPSPGHGKVATPQKGNETIVPKNVSQISNGTHCVHNNTPMKKQISLPEAIGRQHVDRKTAHKSPNSVPSRSKKATALQKLQRLPASPMVTPRRKNSNDLLGFVSLSLPVPRDISTEWQMFKREIITPPWRQKEEVDHNNTEIHEQGGEDKMKVGECSSEEDISDETYFAWHKRSYQRDCARITEILEKQKRERRRKKSNSKQLKKLSSIEKQPPGTNKEKIVGSSENRDLSSSPPSQESGLSQPLRYNYDTTATPWRKPTRLIRFQGIVSNVNSNRETETLVVVPRVEANNISNGSSEQGIAAEMQVGVSESSSSSSTTTTRDHADNKPKKNRKKKKRKRQSNALLHSKQQTPSAAKKMIPPCRGRKKKRRSRGKEGELQNKSKGEENLAAETEKQLKAMKIQYDNLRAELERLKNAGGSPQQPKNEDDAAAGARNSKKSCPSKTSWKAEKVKGKNGQANVIRLRCLFSKSSRE